MKILLIALYDYYSQGIRGLHSFLKAQGHDVTSFYFKNSTYTDGIYAQKELGVMIEKAKSINPDVVGVGIRSPIFPFYKHLYINLRHHLPDAHIIVGGAHATGSPESCLDYADSVVVGDGENGILTAIDGQKGIIRAERVADLDSLPFQHYGPGTYALKAPEPTEKMSVYTTRGCFFNCTYCQEGILRQKPVRKSVKYFKEEIEFFLSIAPHTKLFTLTDPNFLYDTEWLSEFSREFADMNLSFWCAGHAQTLTSEALVLAKAAGVKAIRIGVQSGSKYVRETVFNRKESLEQVIEAAEQINSLGMAGQYDFIIDNPFDTSGSLKETRDFIKRLPQGSLVNKFELRYWPGTKITDMALEQGHIEQDDVEGNFVRLGNWVYLYSRIVVEE